MCIVVVLTLDLTHSQLGAVCYDAPTPFPGTRESRAHLKPSEKGHLAEAKSARGGSGGDARALVFLPPLLSLSSPPLTPRRCVCAGRGGAGGEPHAQPLGPPFSCCSSQSARGAERRRVAAAGRKAGRTVGQESERSSVVVSGSSAKPLRFLGSFRALAESALTGGRADGRARWSLGSSVLTGSSSAGCCRSITG